MDLSKVTPAFWIQNEDDCLSVLKDENHWNSIPLLNANKLQDLPDKKLVRFYGMVQDMFNPEYYFEKYEVVDEISLEKSLRNGKYVDIAECKDTEVVDYDSDNNVTAERQTLVMISVPGLNKWVEDTEKERYSSRATELPTEQSSTTKKRSLDQAEQMQIESQVATSQTSTNESTNKRPCINNANEPAESSVVSREHLLNFPLPQRSGKSCHVKVYAEKNDICLNNIIEVVGFLSVDPKITNMDSTEEYDNQMEIQTHHPPPSLIPRIHCVKWKPVAHNNPLVNKVNLDSERMSNLKKESQIVLTQLFLGDPLAAEYFIYHLISKVYSRNDSLPLGKFTLNISHVPDAIISDYGKRLYEFIEILVTKSHYFPMTLENMNESAFTPKKDYECDRLTSGLLQLTNSTHLILDETKLTAGRLNESGVKAVSALANTIKNQKVPYDFNFFPMEFESDIPILILSEGKSLLPSDFHIALKPDQDHVATFDAICDAAKHFLKPDLLNDLRIYLTLARHNKYELSDDIQKLVQNEYVKMRQETSATADDLHQLLVLARLVCLSEGKTSLDADCWRKACSLEEERKKRLT